jgi:hypothetical protein
MLKSFYEQRGFSRSNFSKWAKRLLVDFIPGIDYEVVNGDYSFEATAELVVILRLKEKYPEYIAYSEIYDAFIKASLRTTPYNMLEKEHLWPKVVHFVHHFWRSRRVNKFAKVENEDIPEEYQDVIIEDNNIILSAPKSMLPEPDPITEENDSPPIYKKTERIELELEEEDDFFDVS